MFCFRRFDKMIQVHLSIYWRELLALGKVFCFVFFVLPSPVYLVELWTEFGWLQIMKRISLIWCCSAHSERPQLWWHDWLRGKGIQLSITDFAVEEWKWEAPMCKLRGEGERSWWRTEPWKSEWKWQVHLGLLVGRGAQGQWCSVTC